MFSSQSLRYVQSVGGVKRRHSRLCPYSTFGVFLPTFHFLMCCHSSLSPSFFSSFLLCLNQACDQWWMCLVSCSMVNLGPCSLLLCSLIQPPLFVQSAHFKWKFFPVAYRTCIWARTLITVHCRSITRSSYLVPDISAKVLLCFHKLSQSKFAWKKSA